MSVPAYPPRPDVLSVPEDIADLLAAGRRWRVLTLRPPIDQRLVDRWLVTPEGLMWLHAGRARAWGQNPERVPS